MNDISLNDNQSNKGLRPLAIVSQLLQSVAGMQHIDELLMQLANTMVQRLHMDVVQIWANQAYTTGALHMQLRVSSQRNSFQIQQISESAEVSALVERMIRDQRGILSIPVSSIFSQYQAMVLAQQNYRFWTVYILSKNVLLPPMQRGFQEQAIPTPLRLGFSFFTQQPLQASDARTVSFLVEQSFRIALSRGLLFPLTQQPPNPVTRKLGSIAQPAFIHLIPERTEITELEHAENPFSKVVMIQEKRIRQIYSFIDGEKNISELALLTRMDQKEIVEALQSLLVQGHIKLRDAAGNPVESSSFLSF